MLLLFNKCQILKTVICITIKILNVLLLFDQNEGEYCTCANINVQHYISFKKFYLFGRLFYKISNSVYILI